MFIIIINTHSGRHGNLHKYKQIKASFTFEDIPFHMNNPDESFWIQIRTTAHKMIHLLKGFIIIGGDGSLHHSINHLKELNLPFGLIPSGSGNDFARSMRIPGSPVKAMKGILNCTHPQPIDLITIGDKSVASILSTGLDAETAIHAENVRIKKFLNRLLIGKFVYILTVFKVIRSFSPFNLTITLDNGEKRHFHEVWLMAIGNTVHYGGGVPMCPKASPVDGQLDIVVIHRVSLMNLILAIPAVFVKKHISFPFVYSTKSNHIQVQTDEELVWQGDGEAIDTSTSMIIDCEPDSVRFLI